MNFLLRKDTLFLWKKKRSSEKLKLAMTSPPVLVFPEENLETVLHTDACGIGLGAVLCQLHDGLEKVVAYASRQLTDVEKMYGTSEQECLAIVFAVSKFRPYLWGRKFTVITMLFDSYLESRILMTGSLGGLRSCKHMT